MDFAQPYSRKTWLDFLDQQLMPEDFEQIAEEIPLEFEHEHIEKAVKIGMSRSLDLPVYEIHHQSENDPRVSLSRGSFRLLAGYGQKRALVLFTSGKVKNYRFSLVTIDLKLEGKKVTKEYSNPRRYSFFLGPEAKTHTPQQYLEQKGKVKDFEDLQKRFSVEVVNKEFYSRIAELFTLLAGGQRGSGKNALDAGKGCLEYPGGNDQKRKEFAVRLIGRLVFCWFLKKKHSAKGLSLLPEDMLSTQAVSENKLFYHSILEPLFFEVFNTPQEDRKKKFRAAPWDMIPFLNGGLFSPHNDDCYELAFTGDSKYINTLKVPDKWLKELFTVFETYNFTIDENTSVDVELSIDPEMLGRIFENLLAEINPETGETARKATGSYYTPRPIVEYMVDESLKQYLITKTNLSDEKVATLLSWSDEEIPLTESQNGKVIEALHQIKVIDPACGSGAFPMGILQKILLVLQKIDPESQKWLELKLSSVKDPLLIKEFKRKVGQPNYLHKLGIIRDCIYGVDIQPIAVEISKLRCFLSLIVDEKVQDSKPNRGIEALPNLEFKFVCANTLIGLPKITKREVTKRGTFNQKIMFEATDEIDELKRLRDEYLNSFGKEKIRLESRFNDIQSKLRRHMLEWREVDTQTAKLAEWRPFKHESCPWFDSDWMFGISTGFDVAIGNPPYGLLNKKQNKGQGVPVTKEQLKYYKTVKEYEPALGGMLNIFRLFIVKSINLLTNQGVFLEIFPLAFIADKSMSSLRKHILQNFTVFSIDAFPERDDQKKRVFEAAKMSVCIMKLVKIQKCNFPFFVRINTDRFIDYHSEVCMLSNDVIKLLDSENYTIPLVSQEDIKVLIKIYRQSKRFVEIGHCYTGEVDMTFGSPYFSDNPKDAILLKGAIVDRYVVNKEMSQGEIVYLNANRFLAENSGEKLTHHKLTRIVMQGITGVNEKIRLKMTLVKNAFCANSVNYLHLKNKNGVDIHFLLALFNSRLMNYVFRKFSTNSNVNGYEVDNLPIPKELPKETQIQVKKMVEGILATNKINLSAKTKRLENQIDRIIYKLYGLTNDEIATVEGVTK